MLPDGRHFRASEFACHGDGSPYPEDFAEAWVTLVALLDGVWDAWNNGPIHVISGYRTPSYNAKLAANSQAHQVASGSYHLRGMAADLRPENGTVEQFHARIMDHRASLMLQGLGGVGLYPMSKWVHVDTGRALDGHLRTWRGT